MPLMHCSAHELPVVDDDGLQDRRYQCRLGFEARCPRYLHCALELPLCKVSSVVQALGALRVVGHDGLQRVGRRSVRRAADKVVLTNPNRVDTLPPPSAS